MGRWILLLLALAALPAPARAQEETHRTEGPYPLVYWRSGEPSEFGMLGPLILFQSEPGKSYSAVLPFFSIERSEKIRLIDVYALWPLIRWRQKGEGVNFHILPLVWHSHDRASGYTVAFPLYWSFRDRVETPEGEVERRTEIGLPLYWSFGTTPGNRYTHLWPFYGHHSLGDDYDSYFVLAPLFRYFEDRGKGEVGADFPWPIGAYRRGRDSYLLRFLPLIHVRRTARSSETIVTPLFGHIEDSERSITWLFPLYGSRRTAESRLSVFAGNLLVLRTRPDYREVGILWPLISFSRSGKERRMRIPPLLWGSAGPEERFLLFLPFGYRWSVPGETDLGILPLFYHTSRLGDDGERGTTLLLPFYYDFRDPASRFTMLFPLYASHTAGGDYTRYIFPTIIDAKEGERKLFQVWPLLFHTRTPEKESLSLIPLLWHERRAEGGHTFVFPFYWQMDDATSSSLFVIPFYGEQRVGETYRRQFFAGGAYVRTKDEERDLDRHDVLYPIFTHKREGEETTTAVRPLFWHRETPEESETLLVPFFYREVSKAQRMFLSLLYSRYRKEGGEGTEGWDNVLGLLYHRAFADDRVSQEILFPVVHTSHSPEESVVQVRPLFWHHRSPGQSYTQLWPLFGAQRWREGGRELRRIATVDPVFSYTWDREGSFRRLDLLFPVFRTEANEDTSRTWLAPLLWSYRSPERSYLHVLPLFHYYRVGTGERESRSTLLLPLYYDFREPGYRSTALLPLFFDFERPSRRFTMVLPFYAADVAGEDYARYIFPTVWDQRIGEWRYFHAWPFYGHHERGEEYDRYFFLTPFFSYLTDRARDERQLDLFWPLVSYRTTPGTESLRVAPLLWHERRPGWRHTVLFPLYWRIEDERSSHLFVIPFYGDQRWGDTFRRQFFAAGAYVRTQDRERDLERHDVLYPLFTHKREGEETTTAVRPLFWHREKPGESETLLVPFFYRQVEKERRMFLSLLYNSHHWKGAKGDRGWDNVLGLLYHRAFADDQVSQEILFPVVHTSHSPEESVVQVRPLFWHADRADGTGHTLLLPSYYHLWGPGRDALNVIPFYTRIERPDGSRFTTLLGPVYLSREKGDRLHEDFLWPIVHHGRDEEWENWEVRPLLWSYRSPERDYTHVLPLFHHRRAGSGERERGSTLLLPLYYRFWRPGKDVLNLIPFYTDIERSDGSRVISILGPMYIRRESEGVIRQDFLWPFIQHVSTREGTELAVLWKLFNYRSDADGFEVNFLQYLVRYERERERVLFEFNPLFQFERTDEMTYFGLLGGVISVDRRPTRTEYGLLYFLHF